MYQIVALRSAPGGMSRSKTGEHAHVIVFWSFHRDPYCFLDLVLYCLSFVGRHGGKVAFGQSPRLQILGPDFLAKAHICPAAKLGLIGACSAALKRRLFYSALLPPE